MIPRKALYRQYIAELEAGHGLLLEICRRLEQYRPNYKRTIWELETDFVPVIKANAHSVNILRLIAGQQEDND